MNSSPPEDQQPRQSLIVRPSSGLIGLPEGRSAPLEEMIQRSLDHLTASASLVVLEPRAGEERDFQIAPAVSIRMCWCPPGTFVMGIKPSKSYPRRNQVEVTLTKGYWMGKYQVTQAHWQAVMGANPSHFKGDNLPVEQVSWNDAQAFLEKLNVFGGNEAGEQMALPTEAQWEYAAASADAFKHSGGPIDQVAWYSSNSRKRTHEVGTKNPNSWGLHDMSGNVDEWCADFYCTSLPGGVNPKGPASGAYPVRRGGSWRHYSSGCQIAARDFGYLVNDADKQIRIWKGLDKPEDQMSVKSSYIGFRIVRISGP